jgi:hypothetical protein
MLQMSRLFLNAEVREAVQNLIEEFKKAGVDLNTKVNTFNMAHQTKRGPDVLTLYLINSGTHG